MRLWLLLAACRASELHIVSLVPQAVQVYWLPGPEAPGRASGELAPAPDSLVISTYAGTSCGVKRHHLVSRHMHDTSIRQEYCYYIYILYHYIF